MREMTIAEGSWIWPSSFDDGPNQYMRFRHEFELNEGVAEATISVSCDSNYALWVNGEFVDSGQYHDYPDHKTCDVLTLTNLRPGKNVLAFILYYQGAGSFQYLKGAPGLIYALKAGQQIVASGTQTRYCRDAAYTSGPIARITGQLGFTFCCDGAGDDGWRSIDYQMGDAWKQVSEADLKPFSARPVERVRPLPKIFIGERIEPRIAAQGVFLRRGSSDATVAQLMLRDFLSSRLRGQIIDGASVISREAAADADGVYLVLDLGREEAGLLDLEIDAGAGTVVDIAWGEQLAELRVRSHVGGRNFAGRYICREGRQRFTHYFTRLAGRYIQIHLSSMSRDVTLHYAGLLPVEYPLEVRGSFSCSDNLHQMIYDTCVRTLHLCMHEHYEDCPWREQALYAMDMRNQALAGYYCFGEYDFPAASLDLLAGGLKPDGFLEMCAPAEIAITIPVFTLAWVLAVSDHYRYSGDRDAASRWWPTVKFILDKRAEEAGAGLLPIPRGDRYWHFYDWAEGLTGHEQEQNARHAQTDEPQYDAPLNMFYSLALEASAGLAEVVGDEETKNAFLSRAAALKPLVHGEFWDEKDQSYITFGGVGAPLHRCELVQALAILAGVCDSPKASTLRERLSTADNGLVETTLSYSFYKFEALLTDPAYGKRVFERIAADWGYMLRNGATSFWETIKGEADFSNAGSLCHGWSGIPAYFYHAYVLGVKPSAPGFESVTRDPRLDLIGPATGDVPTPGGSFSVS